MSRVDCERCRGGCIILFDRLGCLDNLIPYRGLVVSSPFLLFDTLNFMSVNWSLIHSGYTIQLMLF